jgi:hypothetical protein
MFGQTDAHTDTRIIFNFANVVFLGVSYMTYYREMIDAKNTVRERVKRLKGALLGRAKGVSYEQENAESRPSSVPEIKSESFNANAVHSDAL